MKIENFDKLDLKEEIKQAEHINLAKKKIEDKYEINKPVKPSDVPDFPPDITVLSFELVGKYYAIYEAESAYIRYILTEIELKYIFGKQLVSLYKKKIYLAFRENKKISSIEARIFTDTNKNVVESEDDLLALETERLLLQARFDVFSRYAQAMSREITRRKNEDDKMQRESLNIKGKEFNPRKKWEKRP